MSWQSSKTYGHEIGLSCAFRQWKAESHCKFLHGYALSFKFIFGSDELDSTNWVVNFGDLKELKKSLEDLFDHKTVIAEDDPSIGWFQYAHSRGYLCLRVLKDVGCEKFAEYAYILAENFLESKGYSPRCHVVSVEVKEHGANGALYNGNKLGA